jgi:hydroxypyruvate isomerase
MPRFSANISMLFRERPMLQRFAAAEAGFEAVEIQFPYEEDAADLAAAKNKSGLQLAVFNLPVGDMLTGGPGLA